MVKLGIKRWKAKLWLKLWLKIPKRIVLTRFNINFITNKYRNMVLSSLKLNNILFIFIMCCRYYGSKTRRHIVLAPFLLIIIMLLLLSFFLSFFLIIHAGHTLLLFKYRSGLNIHDYNAYPYLNNNKVWLA
jgi:hypothetical protein